MMIVDDTELESELKDSQVTPAIITPMKEKGRSEGDNNVPDGLRKIIGEIANTNGRQEAIELASNFGISPSSVSAYTKGSTSTSSYDNRPNLDFINKSKERVSNRARKTLMRAIDHITDDKLAEAKPASLAIVARNMSAIIKEMEPEVPKSPNEDRNAPVIVLYSPRVNTENHYETISVRE